MVSDDSESVVEAEYREPWSTLSNIGFPVIPDTIQKNGFTCFT